MLKENLIQVIWDDLPMWDQPSHKPAKVAVWMCNGDLGLSGENNL